MGVFRGGRRDCLPRRTAAAIAGCVCFPVMAATKLPTIEIDMGTLEDALRRAEEKLDAKDYAVLKAVVEAYGTISELVDDKKTTIARLRKLLFGARTEKTKTVFGGKDGKASTAAEPSAPPMADAEGGARTAAEENAARTPPPGHGRNAADAYAGAEKIGVRHESLQVGDACPHCGKGTVYETGRPGVLVRLVGQAPIAAKLYELQKLRCGLCGVVFTAASPEGVGTEKYDATAGSMIGVLKYGAGVPFHREEKLQGSLGIPLPASTQWDIVHAKAERIEPAFEELIRQAAQGEVLHNDDTTVKILELIEERGPPETLAEGAEQGSAERQRESAASGRKGMYTTGIVSSSEGRKIALFLSGRQHAGENLKDVLMRRAAELPPPIQMCDALTRNLPGELKTILANCLAPKQA